MRKVVDTLWEISALPAPCATGKTAGHGLRGRPKPGFARRL